MLSQDSLALVAAGPRSDGAFLVSPTACLWGACWKSLPSRAGAWDWVS